MKRLKKYHLLCVFLVILLLFDFTQTQKIPSSRKIGIDHDYISINTCCPEGSFLHWNEYTINFVCRKSLPQGQPMVYVTKKTKSNKTWQYLKTVHLPICENYQNLSEFRVLESGAVIASIPGPEGLPLDLATLWMTLNSSSNCITWSEQNGVLRESVVTCKEMVDQDLESLQLLLKNFMNDLLSTGGKSSGWLSMISALFLGFTILIYILLWRDQNVHGWTQVSFLIALFCMYFSAGLRRLIGYDALQMRKGLAVTLEALEDFGGVATSTNIAALSFDLLYALWNILPTSKNSAGVKRFALTTGLAWGISMVAIALSLVYRVNHRLQEMDATDLHLVSRHLVKRLEYFLCIQMFGMADTIWWPAFLLSLLGINLVMYVGCMGILCRRKKELKITLENMNKTENLTVWIRRFVKLTLLMGLWWPVSVVCLLECMATLEHTVSAWKGALEGFYLGPESVQYTIPWHVHVVSNYLAIQALIICAIFVCNHKTWNGLKKRCSELSTLAYSN